MKKTLSTLILTAAVVLITATFSFAEYAAAGVENFPYFHLGALIVGGMTIVSLKQKYQKLYLSEAMGSIVYRYFIRLPRRILNTSLTIPSQVSERLSFQPPVEFQGMT